MLGRLESSPLPEPATDLLLAALYGQDELDRALGGQSPPRPAHTAGASPELDQPVRAYLRSVTVEGFRGIGPAAKLELEPGPGLTVVCGRNGSGKSSFAEGLEVLLTGRLRRWDTKSAVWRDGWRCLHAPHARLRAELLVEGTNGVTVVERSWPDDAEVAGSQAWAQAPLGQRVSIGELGWAGSLGAYRPFLSHSELESLLAEPKDLYDQLNVLLGLDDLDAAAKALGAARRALEGRAKAAGAAGTELEAALAASKDDRAARALSLLRARTPDLVALEQLAAAGGPSGGTWGILEQLAALSAPPSAEVADAVGMLRDAATALEAASSNVAEHAGSAADLLAMALAHYAAHGPGDCPVCKAPGALDGTWEAFAAERLSAYQEVSSQVGTARKAADAAVAAARGLLRAVPTSLVAARGAVVGADEAAEAWQDWTALPTYDKTPTTLRSLADHMEAAHTALTVAVAGLAVAAGEEVRSREARWAPLAEGLRQFCQSASEAGRAKDLLATVRAAEGWLKSANDALRDEQVRPFADETVALWAQLRQESNVELLRMRLAGSANRSHVKFEVAVDGLDAAGLGVMSQGEVNALALSVFLPRATAAKSALRFVVIDDPVQAMDPAKVAGLARVLADVARTHQVVVFTHDDRLPAAVRDLRLTARVLQVQRRAHSVVEVVPTSGPVSVLLADAASLVAADHLPQAVTSLVVPGICRSALEAACTELTRRRRLANGAPHDEVEEVLVSTKRLIPRLALALLDDPERGGEVYSWLNARIGPWATDTVRACNEGAHGTAGDPAGLVSNTRRLVERMRAAVA